MCSRKLSGKAHLSLSLSRSLSLYAYVNLSIYLYIYVFPFPFIRHIANLSANKDNMTTYRVCFFFRRQYRAASGQTPEAIQEVFGQYSEGGVMREQELRRFMKEVQGEARAGVNDAIKESKYLKELQKKGLSVDEFYHYLFSDDNAAHPSSPGVYQDMTAPLSHYFIYTGHNSYLTGNQLSSDCSDVPIIKALRSGVRVIELDLWPNETNNNVNVLHGRTLTSPVKLIKCLRSIKEHAFEASPYPVIITLEDHLTPNLQAKAAKMLTKTFGNILYTPTLESLEVFPSPEELKMRIMISTKPPKEYLESKTTMTSPTTSHKVPTICDRLFYPITKLFIKEKEHEGQKVDEEEWSEEVSDHEAITNDHELNEHYQEEDPEEGNGKPPIEYKRLIAIAAKKMQGDLTEALKIDPHKVTRLSLSELALEKAASSHGTELIRFTQRNLLRIFPKGTRVTSSNYKPLLGWMHGAQMVALNMQGYGKSLWLVHGMFKANGGCGYVKKPDILLNDNPDQLYDPKATLLPMKTLKVTVYTGDGWRFDYHKSHFDTFSPPDFYARVGIAGVPVDTTMKQTKIIEDCWTPVWDEEFEFKLTVPELALLRIEVFEHDVSDQDDFAGQTCLPVWELRTGIRSVSLCDVKGQALKSVKLLMRFDFIFH
ncbi:phosphoinositide phospholipase C 2-like isoform X1 [Musa acuminata AAA Group]|uniref:phosphoinositide phospholipase C 2-like isoform X1 n=4 Tax=Musa acuminata AAA Group TaxID=214697 RepID=UPI0031DBC366